MIEMLVQWWKKFRAGFCFCLDCRAAHADPRFDEWADQPWPDRTLMINRISCARVALIVRRVSGFAGRKRAQTDWREQKHLHRFNHTTSFVFRQKHERQSADGDDLVRPKCK